MSKDFILPDIGEGIVECEIVEWLVKEGDLVKEDQPVVEVMTDKAVVEIPAKEDGTVKKLYYAKGDIAKVHEPLFAIDSGDESGDSDGTETESKPMSKEPAPSTAAETTDDQSTTTAASADSDTSDFILPDIGEGIVECEIVEWLVKEGDSVKEDQPVVEVMTDKALVEIPAKDDGVVQKLYYAKGDTAKVHEPLFALTVAGSGAGKSAAASSPAKSSSAASSDSSSAESTEAVSQRSGKAVASPAVRRRAREMDIDISKVTGSGKKGRVLKEDLEQATKASDATSSTESRSAAPAAAGGQRTEAIRGVKAAMAKQMAESVRTIPHFTYADEFDLTDILALQKQLKERYKDSGIRITMMPFFIKALSLAMKEFPLMNAKVNDECTEITYYDDHNIGMAVDTKIGLLVPNIKQVQNKSIIEIAEEVTRLTNAAREGKVAQADMKGGTITISNIGVIGGTVATPIINKPEAAIVALGKVQELPRFDANGQVVARKLMTASWSGDHRIIDGGTIARFNKRWQEFLEDPTSMLIHMS